MAPQLPDHVKEYIDGLSPDDIQTLKYTIRIFKAVQGWCRVTRWIFFTLLGFAIFIWQGIDAFKHIADFLTKPHR